MMASLELLDEDGEDWTAEFDLDDAGVTHLALPPQVVGLQANPLDRANWDDDFEFDEETDVFFSNGVAHDLSRRLSTYMAPSQNRRKSLIFGEEENGDIFAESNSIADAIKDKLEEFSDSSATGDSIKMRVDSESGSESGLETSNSSSTLGKIVTDDSGVTGTEDSDEDWDKEFEVESSAQNAPASTTLTTLKNSLFRDISRPSIITDPSEIELEFTVPRPSVARVNIVLYPKASQLYDLRTTDGRRQVSEPALEAWLKDLCRDQHVQIDENDPLSRKHSGRYLLKRAVFHAAQQLAHPTASSRNEITTPLATSAIAQLVTSVFAQNEPDALLSFHRSFFEMRRIHPSIAAEMAHYWIEKCVETAPTNFPDGPSPIMQWQLQQILYFFAKNEISPKHDASIMSLAQADELLRPLGPGWDLLLDDMALVLQAHRKYTNGEMGPFEAMSLMAARYEMPDQQDVSPNVRSIQLQCRTNALVSLVLILHGISPLTLTARAEELDVDSDQESTFRNSQVNLFSPLITSPSNRIEALQQLLTTLPVGFLRAKVSYTLGAEMLRELGDTVTSESLLYESIYILDQSEFAPYLKSSLLGQLGFQALLLYGEVLLKNRKYKFGILSLESALSNLRHRGKSGDEQGRVIERKLAVIASDEKDWQRANTFYRIVLQRATHENKLNEVVHVALMISQICIEQGDLTGAEDVLLRSMELFVGNTRTAFSSGPVAMKPVYWALPQRLCEVYLLFGCSDACLTWLEQALLNDLVPVNKLSVFCFLLAETYSSKGWVKDVFAVLSLFDLGSGGIPSRVASRYSSPSSNSNSNSTSSSSSSGNGNTSSNSGSNADVNLVVERVARLLSGSLLKLPSEGAFSDSIKLSVRTCLCAERVDDALAIVNAAIKLCGESNLVSKGHLWFLKGKVTVASGSLSGVLPDSVAEFERDTSLRSRNKTMNSAAMASTISAATGPRQRSHSSHVSTMPSRGKLAPQFELFSARSRSLNAPLAIPVSSPFTEMPRSHETSPLSPLSPKSPSTQSFHEATKPPAISVKHVRDWSADSGSSATVSPEYPSVISGTSTASSVSSSQNALQRSLHSIASACFTRSCGYFVSAGDRLHIAKSRSSSAAQTLDRWIQIWLRWQHAPVNVSTKSRLEAPFSLKLSNLNETKSLVRSAADFFFGTLHVGGILKSLLSFAELELMYSAATETANMPQAKHKLQSQAYWNEAYFLFASIYIRNNDILLRKRAPTRFLARIVQNAKRLVRMLFCYDTHFVNDHLMAFEYYICAQSAYQQSLQRPLPVSSARRYSVDLLVPEQPSSSSSSSTTSSSSGLVGSIGRKMGSRPLLLSLFPHAGMRRKDSLVAPPLLPLPPVLEPQSEPQPAANHDHSHTDQTPAATNIKTPPSQATLWMSRDPLVEKVWTCFHLMKNNFKRFSKGMLTEEKLRENNLELVHRLQSLHRINSKDRRTASARRSETKAESETTTRRTAGGGDSGGDDTSSTDTFNASDVLQTNQAQLPFSHWVQRVPRDLLDGLTFVVELDGCIMAMTPSSGYRSLKRMPLGTPITSTDVSKWVSITVQINDHSALFRAPTDMSLDAFASYLETLIPAHTADIDSILSLPSTPGGAHNPLMPAVLPGGGLVYVEAYTPGFWSAIRGIPKAESRPRPPSLPVTNRQLFFFALSQDKPEGLATPTELLSPRNVFLSLAHCMHRTVGSIALECFIGSELKSLHLYYVSCGEMEDYHIPRWQSPFASQQLLEFLETISSGSRESSTTSKTGAVLSPGLLNDIRSTFLPWIDDCLMSLSDKAPTKLVIVAPMSLQVLPWPVLVHNAVTVQQTTALLSFARGPLSASNLASSSTDAPRLSSITASNHGLLARFVAFYFEGEIEEVAEVTKERFVADQFISLLAGTAKRVLRGSETSWPWPFQSAIVRKGRKISSYRKKYKLTEFIDLSPVLKMTRPHRDPLGYVRDVLYDRHSDRGCPIVFLFSTADLLAMGDWVEKLLSSEGRLCVLFSPAVVLKKVAKFINDYVHEQLSQLQRAHTITPSLPLTTVATVAATAHVNAAVGIDHEKSVFDLVEQATAAARLTLNVPIILFRVPVLIA